MNDNKNTREIHAIRQAAQCRCGMWLPRGSTAKHDGNPYYPYHCVACRPRETAIYDRKAYR
jgi:hypothetical protein